MKQMQLFQRIRPAIESKAMELQRYEEWSTIPTLELSKTFGRHNRSTRGRSIESFMTY